MYENLRIEKPSDNTKMVRASEEFINMLNLEHEKLNIMLKKMNGKTMTFTDYTRLLAEMQTLRLPAFFKLEPIKKGKKSKKIILDISDLF